MAKNSKSQIVTVYKAEVKNYCNQLDKIIKKTKELIRLEEKYQSLIVNRNKLSKVA